MTLLIAEWLWARIKSKVDGKFLLNCLSCFSYIVKAMMSICKKCTKLWIILNETQFLTINFFILKYHNYFSQFHTYVEKIYFSINKHACQAITSKSQFQLIEMHSKFPLPTQFFSVMLRILVDCLLDSVWHFVTAHKVMLKALYECIKTLPQKTVVSLSSRPRKDV